VAMMHKDKNFYFLKAVMSKSPIELNDLYIEIGKSHKEYNGLTHYDVNVELFDNLIIDSTKEDPNGNLLYLVVNETRKTIKFFTDTENKALKPGEAYIGHIRLPEQLRGKGLAKIIYQEIADKLNVTIIPGNLTSKASNSFWKKVGSSVSPKK
jgi:uncharacterized protein (DUF169 family)